MRLFLMLLAIGLVHSAEEPEAINDEERHDEVAMAQDRAKWIACLKLASSKLEQSASDLEALKLSSKHTNDVIVKKLAADILDVCIEKITWKIAEAVLEEQTAEVLSKFIAEVTIIDISQFSNDKVEFSDRQKALIGQIVEEMNRVDEGFDYPPQVVGELITQSTNPYVVYAAGGALGIVCLWMVWSLFSSSSTKGQEKEQEKDSKRKKRE